MGMRVRMLLSTGTATANIDQINYTDTGRAGLLEMLKLTDHDDESENHSGKGVEGDIVPDIEKLPGTRCLLIE